MAGWQDWVQWRTTAGAPLRVGTTTVTPLAQALVVRLPAVGGGHATAGQGGACFVWNRPVAVLVEREGRIERLPITDVTRVAQWALVLAGVLTSVILVGMRRKKE